MRAEAAERESERHRASLVNAQRELYARQVPAPALQPAPWPNAGCRDFRLATGQAVPLSPRLFLCSSGSHVLVGSLQTLRQRALAVR